MAGRGSGGPGPGTVTVVGCQARQDSPGTAPPPLNPRQNSPSNLKNVKFGVFRARRANSFAHNPTTADAWSAGESKRPGRGARGRRQGAAIAHQPARGLRQSTTLFAQQQPRQATSGTKLSPHTHPRRMCGTKLSQHEPHGPTSGTKLSPLARNSPFRRVLPEQGELFHARAANRPCRENFLPHAEPLPGQNSPGIRASRAQPVQNSPRTPQSADFGPLSARRESFIPLPPPTSRAGRRKSRANTPPHPKIGRAHV